MKERSIRWVITRGKKLCDLNASDVPRGLDPEDVAIDFGSEPTEEERQAYEEMVRCRKKKKKGKRK